MSLQFDPAIEAEKMFAAEAEIGNRIRHSINSQVDILNEQMWNDLDKKSNENHFKENCYVSVEFLNSSEIIKKYLPIYPEDISFSSTTNFADASIIGRPGTISGYVNTSDVTTRFSLHLHRELIIPGDTTTDVNKIDELVSFIEALGYPKNTQGGLFFPIVTYKFGDTVITGKQTSWNVKWSGPKIENVYMDCTMEIGVTHTPKGIQFFDDILRKNPRNFN